MTSRMDFAITEAPPNWFIVIFIESDIIIFPDKETFGVFFSGNIDIFRPSMDWQNIVSFKGAGQFF